MGDLSCAGGENQGVYTNLTAAEKMNSPKRKSFVPWMKKRISFRNRSRRCSFERPGLVMFSQRAVVAKTLSSLMDHRDALTMTSLEGWITDPNGILPYSVAYKVRDLPNANPPLPPQPLKKLEFIFIGLLLHHNGLLLLLPRYDVL